LKKPQIAPTPLNTKNKPAAIHRAERRQADTTRLSLRSALKTATARNHSQKPDPANSQPTAATSAARQQYATAGRPRAPTAIAATIRVGATTGAQAKLAASQPPKTRATRGGGLNRGSLIGKPAQCSCAPPVAERPRSAAGRAGEPLNLEKPSCPAGLLHRLVL